MDREEKSRVFDWTGPFEYGSEHIDTAYNINGLGSRAWRLKLNAGHEDPNDLSTSPPPRHIVGINPPGH